MKKYALMGFFFFLGVFTVLSPLKAQESVRQVMTIAFYNVENLFDIHDDPNVWDEEFTPKSQRHWNKDRYLKKLEDITKVILEIGRSKTNSSPVLIGLSEIENYKVLYDLTQHQNIRHLNYAIAHKDSPDFRGIDVALLYRRGYFKLSEFSTHTLSLKKPNGKRIYTRDLLLVKGTLDDELFYILVNHWPSRRGGASKSEKLRMAAARLNRKIIDSIKRTDENAKIICMGDFNDNPNDKSIKSVLGTFSQSNLKSANWDLYNPMDKIFKKGYGTLGFRDRWFLFDQIIISRNLFETSKKSYRYWKVGIFNKDYLKHSGDRFEGYPFRTYVGKIYKGGYSDHFPVYIVLVK